MKSQAAFVLVAFLYLASPFVTVQAVHYDGPTIVNEGEPWSIECSNHQPGEKFNWTRNGQPLEVFTSSDLSILTKLDKGTSKISAEHATDLHEGYYSCTPGRNQSIHLSVKSVTKIKVVPHKGWLNFACGNTTEKNVEWQKDGVDVRTVFAGKENLVKVFNENGTINVTEHDSVWGNYTCNTTSSGNATIRYRIVPKPIVYIAKSISVVEGEKLHAVCAGNLYPGAKISWVFSGKNYTVDDQRVHLVRDEERGVNRAILNVDDIQMTDYGNVSCWVAYDWSDPIHLRANATTLLRVKDKLAALWPFLGIVAEVIVLCAIIMIYEKKRNKAELDESDTDQSPDTSNLRWNENSESFYVPLRGPLPPSDLPVHPPITPPEPSVPIYKTVQFRSPSREPRRDSPMRSAPPSTTTIEHVTAR